MREPLQKASLFAGLALLGASVGAEVLDWGETGFGALQQVAAVFGLGFALIGALPREAVIARLARTGILVAGALYFSLLLAEIGLLVVTPYQDKVPAVFSLRGSVTETTWGFGMKPGWKGTFDDGVVQAPIEINALGDRDALPRSNTRRILLAGDSVVFGFGLADGETIATRIEQRSKGKIDAYNLGVLAYGPEDTADKLEAGTTTTAEHVFYVFSGNDLRDDARQGTLKVWNGYLVPANKPDGTPYTDVDYAAQTVARQADTTLRQVLSLSGVQGHLAKLFTRDASRVMGPIEAYKPEGIQRAIQQTARMAKLARSRGQEFTVVVVPMLGEAEASELSDPTKTYLDGLVAEKIEFVNLVEDIGRECFFGHDPHLNAHGADKTAAAILDSLSK